MVDHTVGQGECLASIARQYGLFWQTIWNDPANAELKRRRRNPNVLKPGDVLRIPESSLKWVSCATEQRHRFLARGTPARLRVRLLRNNEPRAHVPYTLSIDGRTFTGTTDGEGWLTQSIPNDAQRGRLSLDNGCEVRNLVLGHLDPVDDIAGLQQRLSNLGLYGGPADGILGPETEAALALFQSGCGLEATGRLDDATRDALADGYKS